jgi:hypothetical protein
MYHRLFLEFLSGGSEIKISKFKIRMQEHENS